MGNWSIELCERPMNTKWFVRPFFSKTNTHSFIRIMNDQQKPVLELHGLYSKGKGLGAIFNTVAKTITGHSSHLCTLDVIALTSPRLMDIFTAHLPVTSLTEITAPQDEILRATECMVRAAQEINQKKPDYFFNFSGGGDDQTCHTVSAALLRRIGIDITRQPLPFTTPGRQTDLEKIDPALKTIVPDRNAPMSTIRETLQSRIALISPDYPKSPYWSQTARAQLAS